MSALALRPVSSMYAVGEAGYVDALADAAGGRSDYGLVGFDGVSPDASPTVPALYLDPPDDGPYGTIDGRVEAPLIDRPDPDEPVLRFVASVRSTSGGLAT